MDKKIDIVITMGGLGSRFRKMGYTVPKYMIEAKGKTLFEWSLISLEGFRNEAERYISIAMKDENNDVKSFIEEKCAALGISEHRIMILDYLTDGQATTAKLASKYWDPENALLIYNIDTYVEAGEMNSGELKGDGFIPCFKADGDHWSFVRLDENGRVAEIREKKRISDHCTLGAYYFRTCALYEKLYDEFYGGSEISGGDPNASQIPRALSQPGKADSRNTENTHPQKLVNGEKYVAPLYDYLLSKGGEIYISDISPKKVHVLGTPEELEEFLGQ